MKAKIGSLVNGQNFRTLLTERDGTILEMSESRWEPVKIGFPLPDGKWQEKTVHPNVVVEVG